MDEHQKEMDFSTQLVHSGWCSEDPTQSSSVPVFRASTFNQPDLLHVGEWIYSRSGNPTRTALEKSIAVLEKGEKGFAFSSGIAAINACLLLLGPGQHLVVSEDIYGGTFRSLTTIFRRWGLEVSWVDPSDLKQVETAIRPGQTRAIFVETPSNPCLKICDLKAIADLAHQYNLLALTDNTFQTPMLQKPLDFGFDIVVHSATKFLGGHSDVIAGLAVVRDPDLAKELNQIQNGMGMMLNPDDCWLVLRGLKTLEARLSLQQKNAQILAEWMRNHQRIKKVYYPGLADHEGKEIHDRQSQGAGAVISFELKDQSEVLSFMKNAQIPLKAVSLGGVESILSYPAMMSHAAMPEKERLRRGISSGLIRLSVGLESVDDLMKDFEKAFDHLV